MKPDVGQSLPYMSEKKIESLEAEINRLQRELESQKDAQQSGERERFLHLLNDITFAALSTSSLDELLQLLADRMAELINAHGAYITLYDEETGRVTPGAAYGPLRDIYKSDEVIPKPNEPTMTETVLERGAPIVVDDVSTSPYVSHRFSQIFPAKCHLALPLISRGRKLGAALIAFNEVHTFTEQEIRHCEQAAGQVSLAIANAQAMQEQEDVRQALLRSEQHLRRAQSQARIGSSEYDPDNGTLTLSEEMYSLFDIEHNQHAPTLDELLEFAEEPDRRSFRQALQRVADTRNSSELEFRTFPREGAIRHFAVSMQCNRSIQPGDNRITLIVQDVTQRVELEEQLIHAGKMEAVGRLAGGIAHDFNNILTVIIGNHELLKSSLPADAEEQSILDRCIQAAERAATLTRQLLVVSRKQILQPRLVNVNELVRQMSTVLEPLTGDHIALTVDLADDLGMIRADAGQIEQVVMNLTINAKDEMPAGGRIDIVTRNVTLHEKTLNLEPGDYIRISVSDTGPGIDDQTRPHIFEPFFTTKDQGKGTGLGLAIVYGIVEQSGGDITVTSEAGRGATFNVLLPRHDQQDDDADDTDNPDAAKQPTGKETILLAEDHSELRQLIERILGMQGYTVLSAGDGQQALAIAQQYQQPIELLLTDVLMPGGLSGADVADEVQRMIPGIKVLYMSGYADNQLLAHGVEASARNFIAKPFKPAALIQTIREVIDQAADQP